MKMTTPIKLMIAMLSSPICWCNGCVRKKIDFDHLFPYTLYGGTGRSELPASLLLSAPAPSLLAPLSLN